MFYQNEPFPQPAPPHLAKYRLTVLLTIVVLSFFTRYYLIQHPAQVSFDEVHFGHFANNYIDGKYFFDIHPPLGTPFPLPPPAPRLVSISRYSLDLNLSFLVNSRQVLPRHDGLPCWVQHIVLVGQHWNGF
jgi:hypothetical protein